MNLYYLFRWALYPDHKNLLPSYFALSYGNRYLSPKDCVSKRVFGREGKITKNINININVYFLFFYIFIFF